MINKWRIFLLNLLILIFGQQSNVYLIVNMNQLGILSLLLIPVTNPALIARNQGVISGLIYLESYVYKIINDRKMERDEKEGKINLPNYNS